MDEETCKILELMRVLEERTNSPSGVPAHLRPPPVEPVRKQSESDEEGNGVNGGLHDDVDDELAQEMNDWEAQMPYK